MKDRSSSVLLLRASKDTVALRPLVCGALTIELWS